MTTKTRYFIRPLALLVLAALGASMMILLASQAQAASLIVTTEGDELNTDGDCSLREAIEAANTNTAVDACVSGSSTVADTIGFAASLSGQTITLGSQPPPITNTAGLTIDGGSADITISGNKQVRVFFVEPHAELTLSNLTVADGATSGTGGGIWNDNGTLEVNNSTFSGNSATSGGGITSEGALEVNNSTFSGNSPAIQGGGIVNVLGNLEVNNSTFSGNSAAIQGGGIVATEGAHLTVTNSTFSGNSATRQGGGIFYEYSPTATITNSTFSGNSASSGGGIMGSDASISIGNTILASSPCSTSGSGTFIDGGYNLDGGTTCGFTDATSQSNANPLLGQLQDNGGPTQTHALGAGSPAIDAIPDTNGATPGCGDAGITADQRGVARPQGPACDIGAYEVEVEDTTPPTVTTTIPEDGAPEVSRTTTVKANFSEPVQNVSTETFMLERKITVKKAPPKYVLVDATVSPSADGMSAELTPVQDLPKGDYRATITTEVTDLADPANALDQESGQAGNQPKVWTFTVAK